MIHSRQKLLWALLISAACVPQTLGQTSSSPANAPQTSSAGADKKKATAESQAKPAAARPHKVITNDDLDAEHKMHPHPTGPVLPHSGREFLLNCDAVCEREAKELLQIGPDREADWQMQVIAARSELAKDDDWRALLAQLIQESRTYCTFVDEQSRTLAPTGDTFNARMQRAKQEQYFQTMGASLRQAFDSTWNRASARVRETSELFPARGAMMQVQLSRVGDLYCEDLPRL